jgi:hypothetical protein
MSSSTVHLFTLSNPLKIKINFVEEIKYLDLKGQQSKIVFWGDFILSNLR